MRLIAIYLGVPTTDIIGDRIPRQDRKYDCQNLPKGPFAFASDIQQVSSRTVLYKPEAAPNKAGSKPNYLGYQLSVEWFGQVCGREANFPQH